jgi:hypothetical protein
MRDTFTALFVGTETPSTENIEKLRPLLVSKSRVKLLIEFLIDNNPHYQIGEGFCGLDTDALNNYKIGGAPPRFSCKAHMTTYIRLYHIILAQSNEHGKHAKKAATWEDVPGVLNGVGDERRARGWRLYIS